MEKVEKKLKVMEKHLDDILELVVCITEKTELNLKKRLLKEFKLNPGWDGLMM